MLPFFHEEKKNLLLCIYDQINQPLDAVTASSCNLKHETIKRSQQVQDATMTLTNHAER